MAEGRGLPDGSAETAAPRRDTVRERILDVAERMFANQSFAGVSIRNVTAEAGVNLPPVQPMNARRIQLSSAPADAVAPLKMLFTLAEGKSRLVADPQGRAFFVVKTLKKLGRPATRSTWRNRSTPAISSRPSPTSSGHRRFTEPPAVAT